MCRRWCDVLSSDKFARTALKRFDTHDPQDSALDAEAHASSSHMSALRHILALQNGRPFSFLEICEELAFVPSSQPVTHLIRLKGKHLAYLRGDSETREGNTVVVNDLVSGEWTALCGTAREKVMSIQLTSDIVAFLTYAGTVYVASLLNLTDSLQCVRLPSSSVLATSSCQATLACLIQGALTPTAVIYDAVTRRTHSFSLQPAYDLGDGMGRFAILIDSRKQCIDVFSLRKSLERRHLHIDVSRFSFAGERIMHTSSKKRHEVSTPQNCSIGPVEPTGERGIHQLALSYEGGHLYKRGPRFHRWTLIYNATTMKLKAIDCFTERGPFDHMHFPKPALWKDRLYRSELDPLLVSTARRPAPFDGPHTLRNIRNDTYDDNYIEREDEKNNVIVQPSSLRSWKADQQEFTDRRLEWARRHYQPTTLPKFHPNDPLGLEVNDLPPGFMKVVPPERFHTIVAMNDTFGVAIYQRHGFIGVMCFDERVTLHGGGKTFLWNDLDDQLHHGSGPGLVDVKVLFGRRN